MSQIIWLASYPKSGNTWLRVMLANYVRDGDAPIDINSLADDSFAHAARRTMFDELVGVEASGLPPALIDRLRPAVYRRLATEAAETLYVKVHDAWDQADDGSPLFPGDVTAGVIYVVRNPLDVAASFAHHTGVDLETAVGRMCDEAYAMAAWPDRLNPQLRQRLGSWSQHVGSWLDRSGLRCLVVRYEDLHRDPQQALAGAVRFCGLAVEQDQLRKAIAFSDFTEVRRQEQAHGFNERLAGSRGDFFRRGEVGGWRDELPEALAGQLVQAHGPTMRRFAYDDR